MPAKKRPEHVVFLAVLNCAASFVMCCVWGGACLRLEIPGHGDTDLITRQIPEYQEYARVQAWTGIFMSLWLIVASLRLLNNQRGGRAGCIFYAGYAIAAQLVGAAVAFLYVQPAIDRFRTEHDLPADALTGPGYAVAWMLIMLHATLLLAAMIRYDEAAYLDGDS